MTPHRNLLAGGALAVLVVLFVAVITISNTLLRGARIDLTQNHLYTLSSGTKNILASIDEPIQLYFFFSDKATQSQPQVRTYAQRVREMLDEMVMRSRGKLKLEVIDPLPFSEDEDRATSYGVQGVPAGQNDENIYLGLVGTNSTNGKAVIPFLHPDKEAFLEYDIAKLIHELSTTQKTTVGMISTLPMGGSFDPMTRSMSSPWEVEEQLKQLFDVREIDPGSIKTIDPAINVLVLVHPKRLPDDAQYAIDQFVMRGGHLIAFVDPNAGFDRSSADPGNPQAAMFADRSSDLPRLFKAWGVEYDPHSVVLDRALAVRVALPGGASARDPSILGLTSRDLNSDDVITANLTRINVASPGFFKLASGSQYKLTPLLQTSSDAMVVPSSRVRFVPDPSQLLEGYVPGHERYIIAGRLEGKFVSAFPERNDPGHLARAKESGEIILVADTDILTNRTWVQIQPFFGQNLTQAFASNGDFFINAVDNMAGSADLISIRGRATSQRPFVKVDDMTRAAEESFRGKELELQRQLSDTERKLSELQSQKTKGNALVLSPEQQTELTSFVQKKLEIRKQLRQVRRGLDEQIDALGSRLKLINIGLVPSLITLAALAFAWWKRRRRST
jgi:ABC-type uncharacterized transport system involved in gliding motility auxiliary subunit